MTNKRKIEILQGAIKMIKGYKDNRKWYGLCFAVECQLTNEEREKYDAYNSLRFLHIKKPKQATKHYWFPLTKAGDAQRIKLCNEVIKELKK